MSSTTIRRSFNWISERFRRPKRHSRHTSRRLRIEPLEDRRLLAVDTGWAFEIAGGENPNNGSYLDVGTGPDGNIYVMGTYQGTRDFDPDSGTFELTAEGIADGSRDGFLAKYTPDQQLVWARSFGGSGNERVKKIGFDAVGNAYVQGWSNSVTMQFGSQTVTNNGGYDAYVAKVDTDGNFLWARGIGGSGNEWGVGLTVDDSGNVLVGGKLDDTVDFDPTASHPGNVDILNTFGGNDAFVLKLDTDGDFQWVYGAGGAGDDVTHRVTNDSIGNVYAIGVFQGTADFGSFSLNAQGSNHESFMVKLNASGTPQWGRHFASAGETAQARIRSDGESIYAVGRFTDTMSFRDENGNVLAGSPTLTSGGGWDTFISKWDANGNLLWAKQFSGSPGNRPWALNVDGTGAYIAGNFGGATDFDPGPGVTELTSGGGYLAKLDTGGNLVWAHEISGDLKATGIDVDGAGIVYAAGDFVRTAVFPMGEVLSEPRREGFLLKLNPQLAAIQGQIFNDLDNDGVNDDGAGVKNMTIELFEDQNGNGVLDETVPVLSTTTDAQGRYAFGNLQVTTTPVTYFVRQIVPVDWTQTYPQAAATHQTVSLASGQAVTGINFGNFTPSTTSTYSSNTTVPILPLQTVSSTITVSDSFEVFDMDVAVDMQLQFVQSVSLALVSPDGTRVPLHLDTGGSNLVFDDEELAGALRPAGQLSDFDGMSLSGDWTLEITDLYDGGLSGGPPKLLGWSMIVIGPGEPAPPTSIEASDGFETGSFSGGIGWASAWTVAGDASVRTDGPNSGSYHARLRRSSGDLIRSVDTTGLDEVTLGFWGRLRSFEGSDRAWVKVSSDGSNWTTLREFANGEDDNQYHYYEFDVPVSGNTLFIRFDAGMSGSRDYWYIDDVQVTGTPAGPPNQLPFADAGGPYSVDEGSAVTLDASGSSDPDGAITAYAWDLDNDGQYDDATGVATNFTPTQHGVLTVGLRVTDDLGGTATDTATVNVANVAPTADAGGPYDGSEGTNIVLSGAGSSDPADDIVSYDWDLDNDGQYDDASGVSVVFNSTDDGVFTVGLRVTDDFGATSTDTASVTVSNVAPTADAGGPYSTDEGVDVTVTAAGSSDPGNDIDSYAWDLDNDGDYDDATGVTATFNSATAGVFNVAVKVTDDDGQFSTDSTTVTVSEPSTNTTKFFVVDASLDDMFEYQADGTYVTNYNLDSGNNAPRGAAATATGDTVWVIDNDDHVYVHDADGNLLRSWKALGLSRPEGIATDGTDVWIVDRGNDRVHYFAGGATRTTDAGATSSFSLAAGNPRGITTDGTFLWVVDTRTDKVYKYAVSGALQGSWSLTAANANPRGITIDPSGTSNSTWVVDSGSDAVYEYHRDTVAFLGSFSLAAGNTNPQGIADPPPASGALPPVKLTVQGSQDKTPTSLFAPLELDALRFVPNSNTGKNFRASVRNQDHATINPLGQFAPPAYIPPTAFRDALFARYSGHDLPEEDAALDDEAIDSVFSDKHLLDDLVGSASRPF